MCTTQKRELDTVMTSLAEITLDDIKGLPFPPPPSCPTGSGNKRARRPWLSAVVSPAAARWLTGGEVKCLSQLSFSSAIGFQD